MHKSNFDLSPTTIFMFQGCEHSEADMVFGRVIRGFNIISEGYGRGLLMFCLSPVSNPSQELSMIKFRDITKAIKGDYQFKHCYQKGRQHGPLAQLVRAWC